MTQGTYYDALRQIWFHEFYCKVIAALNAPFAAFCDSGYTSDRNSLLCSPSDINGGGLSLPHLENRAGSGGERLLPEDVFKVANGKLVSLRIEDHDGTEMEVANHSGR